MKKITPLFLFLFLLTSCSPDPEIAVERTFDCEVNYTQTIKWKDKLSTDKSIDKLIDIKVEVKPFTIDSALPEAIQEISRRGGSARIYSRDEIDLLVYDVKPCSFKEDEILCGSDLTLANAPTNTVLSVGRDGGEFLYNMNSDDGELLWKQSMVGDCKKRKD